MATLLKRVSLLARGGNLERKPAAKHTFGSHSSISPPLIPGRTADGARTEIDKMPRSDRDEEKRIQEKQGGHHMPPKADDGPPLDDTDRNTDKVIKPSRRKP